MQRAANTSWLRPAPLRQALTALALDVERGNPFRLPSREPSSASGARAARNASRSRLGKRSLGERIKA